MELGRGCKTIIRDKEDGSVIVTDADGRTVYLAANNIAAWEWTKHYFVLWVHTFPISTHQITPANFFCNVADAHFIRPDRDN